MSITLYPGSFGVTLTVVLDCDFSGLTDCSVRDAVFMGWIKNAINLGLFFGDKSQTF